VSQTPELLDALRAVQEVLDGEDLRWFLFGAQAVVVYGQPRLTADVDVTLEASLKETLPARPARARLSWGRRTTPRGEPPAGVPLGC
jgi:hypothetical protein